MDQTAQARVVPTRSGNGTRLALFPTPGARFPVQSKLPSLWAAVLGAVALFAVFGTVFAGRADESLPLRETEVTAAETDGQGRNGRVFAEEARETPPEAPAPPGDPPKAEGEQQPQAPAKRVPPRPCGEEDGTVPSDPVEWELYVKTLFAKRISFDFVDTPAQDVFAFIPCLTGLTIILDPGAKADERRITLKVSEMRLGSALDWLVRLAGLEYELQDWAVFVSTRERFQALTPIRVYDCRELLNPAAQQELLDLIVQVSGASWHQDGAIMRFLDGRLVLRHDRAVMEKAAAFMDAFIEASDGATQR